MNIEGNLEELGLSRQEANIYVATLKLGVAKASQIAQKSGIMRGGVYYILKLLKEKGYVNEVIKSGVQYYGAVSPERILDIVEEERNRKKEIMKEIIGDLKEMQQSAIERPLMEIYEGYEGFKTIFSKLIEKPKQEFRCYMSADILNYLPHFHEQFRKRRSQQDIKIRTITERTPVIESIKKLDKKELRETRYNDVLLKNTHILYYILDDAVVIIRANKKEQMAIYIKDENLAQLQKNIFEKEWKQSKV
ncbi:MAG: helix-turn-helix domain-containing protein [Candidatus Pacearchaeota archaeon]|nr:helix-turn-helix domain-containing protein [Candidatus Pacearchaeota archaeon]